MRLRGNEGGLKSFLYLLLPSNIGGEKMKVKTF